MFPLQNLSIIINFFPSAEPESSHLVHSALNNCLKWCNKRTSAVQWVLIIADWDFRVWWAYMHKGRLAVVFCLFGVFGAVGGMCLWMCFRHPLLKERKRTHYLFIDVMSSNKSILTCTLGAFFFFLRENNFHYLKNCLHVFSSKKEDKICIATTEG